MLEPCSIDFETRSAVDLTKAGLHRYAEDHTTGVWCMAWAFGFGPISLWRDGDPFPAPLADHAKKGGTFRAWNMAFERTIWNTILHKRQGWPVLPLQQAHCTQAQAMCHGLPAALDKTAQALAVTARKDQEGRRLMLKLCRPRLNNGTQIIWHDDPDEHRRLGAYCMQDVETERAIAGRLRPMSDDERAVYMLDQVINDRGMALDSELVHAALTVVSQTTQRLDHEVREWTKGMVQDTRKRIAMLNWLWVHGDEDDDLDSIDKYALARLLKRDDLSEAMRAVLTIRQEAAKSSTAKLVKMQQAINRDGRIRGTLQYYGARQTGRWAGRTLQPQNMPRGHIKAHELETVVADIKQADRDVSTRKLELLYGPPLDLVASVLRGCIIAGPGKTLYVADFNAIEARVLAWLAGETPLLDQFKNNGDPYKTMAARVYQCAPDDVDDDMRWLGKQLILSCGYGTGWRSFQNRVAKEGREISDDEAQSYIGTYRYSHPCIVDFWASMDAAAKEAIRNPGTIYSNGKLAFGVKQSILYMRLPSQRFLAYLRPSIEWAKVQIAPGEEFEAEQIFYWGVSPITYQWARQYSYGAKLVENATQAIARDLLAQAMLRVERAGFPVVLHVHDEIVSEVGVGLHQLPSFVAAISQVPEWANGCPIAVKGWEGPRYRK